MDGAIKGRIEAMQLAVRTADTLARDARSQVAEKNEQIRLLMQSLARTESAWHDCQRQLAAKIEKTREFYRRMFAGERSNLNAPPACVLPEDRSPDYYDGRNAVWAEVRADWQEVFDGIPKAEQAARLHSEIAEFCARVQNQDEKAAEEQLAGQQSTRIDSTVNAEKLSTWKE